MMRRLASLLACSVAISGAAFATSASAATHHTAHHRHAARVADTSSSSSSTGSSAAGGSGETALTGSTLSSATAAALAAVPGGTVDSATTENDATGAYEVIVTKTDGSRVKVIEDASFAVLSTSATHCG